MTSLIQKWKSIDSQQAVVGVWGIIIVVSILLGLITEQYILLLAPAAILLAFVAIVDIKKIFWLLLFSIPISMEVPISLNLATDLPTEPLTIFLMGVGLLLLLKEGRTWRKDFLVHPITLLLLLHIGWMIACTITSDLVLFSVKFSLAKIWYVATFYFLTGYFLQHFEDYKKFFWIIFIPLAIASLIVLIRHSFHGFAFDKANSVTWPFFRNHVNSAAIQVLFIPFVFLCRQWYPKGSLQRRLLTVATFFFIITIYFSYTRAAYLSLIIAIGAFYIVKYKLTKVTLAVVMVTAILTTANLYRNNNYLDLAPNFENTITHYDFNDLVAATAKGEDISTMERVYRWVAGAFLVKDHPWMGVGPGNFYSFYQKYSLNAFSTYVSHNPDRSGVHCYYLLMAVEQGIPGMIIFIALVAMLLIYGERIYHQTKDKDTKTFVMSFVLCLIVIFALLLINDLIETDKIGSFFFIGMALLVNIDINNRRLSKQKNIEQI